jgi:pyruvate/2-oxoglutarate dehydrogenase complex dihydrolipoamide dehydrogenase (E3) component
VVIGSSAARTSRRRSSRQTRQEDCGGWKRSVALGGASINTGTIPSKTLQEAALHSTRSGSTDRRISASNLAQRIEEVAFSEVRVFEIRLRLDELTDAKSSASREIITMAALSEVVKFMRVLSYDLAMDS